ncbi:MAG: glucose PTS transporter subunit IIA [Bacillota bacterium]|nr:glucose PTS transporter subunit IIA [Bacillota bacterium]
MFQFSKKDKGKIFSPQNGKAVLLHQVPDNAFSKKMIGDGIAIIPEDGKVYSPVNGIADDVPNTLHNYQIKSDDGLDILIQVGIGTSELMGEGFKTYIKKGDKVKKGDLIAYADLNLFKEKGFPIHSPIIITNIENIKNVKFNVGNVKAFETVIMEYRKL